VHDPRQLLFTKEILHGEAGRDKFPDPFPVDPVDESLQPKDTTFPNRFAAPQKAFSMEGQLNHWKPCVQFIT